MITSEFYVGIVIAWTSCWNASLRRLWEVKEKAPRKGREEIKFVFRFCFAK